MVLAIEVVDADWGGVLPAEVEGVIRLVAACFEGALAEAAVDPIRVEPTASPRDPPRCSYRRTPAGQIRILLQARERYWARYSFQFAHELGHVLSGSGPSPRRPWRWIEETLCEAASQYAIRCLSRRWETSPPFPRWSGYAPAFTRYLEDHYAKPGHSLPDGARLDEWLRSHRDRLEQDGFRRADNTLVARELSPIFVSDPDAWRAVRYLNFRDAVEVGSVAELFARWRKASPTRLLHHVDAVQRCLTCG